MKNNSRGMSLVAVMIAGAIAAMIAVYIAKMMDMGNKSLKTQQLGQEVIDFEYKIEDLLKNRDACTQIFGKIPGREGKSPSSLNILDTHGIYNADGDELWKKDDLIRGGLKLISFKVPDKVIDPTTNGLVDNLKAIGSTSNTSMLDLYIDLEKSGGALKSFGGKNKRLVFSITAKHYNLNSSPKDTRIEWCQLTGGESAGAVLQSHVFNSSQSIAVSPIPGECAPYEGTNRATCWHDITFPGGLPEIEIFDASRIMLRSFLYINWNGSCPSFDSLLFDAKIEASKNNWANSIPYGEGSNISVSNSGGYLIDSGSFNASPGEVYKFRMKYRFQIRTGGPANCMTGMGMGGPLDIQVLKL